MILNKRIVCLTDNANSATVPASNSARWSRVEEITENPNLSEFFLHPSTSWDILQAFFLDLAEQEI